MITLSMIVKNEEKHLRACLDSVKGIVDEIVVVDTGSTDNTIEIAKEFGAMVFHFDWVDDFSAARNFALEKSSGSWILYLDADERLSKTSEKLIKKLNLRNTDTAYNCIIRNLDEINERPSVMTYVRLFPNKKNIKFEGAVHEQIENSLRKNKIKIVHSGIEIIHLGYSLPKAELQKKAQRNLEVLIKAYHENNGHHAVHSSYYAFHLGQTYGILEDTPNAVEYFNAALKDHFLLDEYKSLAYRYLAVHEAEKQNWDSALDLIHSSLRADSSQPLALMVASKIYLKLKSYGDAEKYCRDAFIMNEKLFNGEKISAQAITMDKETILLQGLHIALEAGNKNDFNFYYKILSESKQCANEYEVFDCLMNNRMISSQMMADLPRIITPKNLELFLKLLSNYKEQAVKQKVFEMLKDKFRNDFYFLNKYGAELLQLKRYEEAQELLEKSIEANRHEASTYFYLSSVYLLNNNIEKILPLIAKGEQVFNESPQVTERLKLLRQKILQYTN